MWILLHDRVPDGIIMVLVANRDGESISVDLGAIGLIFCNPAPWTTLCGGGVGQLLRLRQQERPLKL